MQRLIFCSLLAVSSCWSVAQEAQPAEMLAQPYFEKSRLVAEDYQAINHADFAKKYNARKQPTLMVFVGKSFGNFVSDWQSNSRVQFNARIKSDSKELPKAVTADASVQVREQQAQQRSNALTADEWQEFDRGFREVLLGYRVKLLQQNLATRLLDAELRDSAKELPIDDSLRMETDVLRKHSKLLIEVLPYDETRRDKQPIGYQISVSSLASATLVAEKRVGLNFPMGEYKAGANGYELQAVAGRTDYQAGARGYDVIRSYPNLAYENGKSVGLALIELLYQAGLDSI